MLGLSQLDTQAMAHLQMHPKHMMQHHQYSFDDQLAANYYDTGGGGGGGSGAGGRMNLLQQAQSHSFNMEMLSGINNNQQYDFMSPQQMQQYQQSNSVFQRNNTKRNTLRRSQRVMDSSVEDISGASVAAAAALGPNEFNNLMLSGNLSPQQQQQILMMRNQQYSNNSSGQESGIGTGSNATNSAHGTHDLLMQQQQHRHRQNLSPNQTISIDNQLINNSPNNMSPNANQSSSTHYTDNLSLPPPPQLPRRKSLPSIVKSKSFKEDETAHSSSDLNDKNQETFIIENGIRKRVTEKSNSALNQNKLGIDKQGANSAISTSATTNQQASDSEDKHRLIKTYDYDDDQTPQLPRKIVLESVTSLDYSPIANSQNSKRVSMPSIPAYLSPKFANKGTKNNLFYYNIYLYI